MSMKQAKDSLRQKFGCLMRFITFTKAQWSLA